MKTYLVSKKETDKIIKTLNQNWINITIPKIKNIKVFEIEDTKSILIIESIIAVSISDDIIIPFLGKPDILDNFSSVTVDSGSIKFICNGAKVLRPGIVKFDNFNKNDIVTVKDEKFKKYIAVGIAMEDSSVAEKLEKGPIINNLHFVGDKFWNSFKEISFRI